jgi:hypothetical protein
VAWPDVLGALLEDMKEALPEKECVMSAETSSMKFLRPWTKQARNASKRTMDCHRLQE